MDMTLILVWFQAQVGDDTEGNCTLSLIIIKSFSFFSINRRCRLIMCSSAHNVHLWFVEFKALSIGSYYWFPTRASVTFLWSLHCLEVVKIKWLLRWGSVMVNLSSCIFMYSGHQNCGTLKKRACKAASPCSFTKLCLYCVIKVCVLLGTFYIVMYEFICFWTVLSVREVKQFLNVLGVSWSENVFCYLIVCL